MQTPKGAFWLFKWSVQFACLSELAFRDIITIFKSEIPSFSVGWYLELLVLEDHVSKLHLGGKKIIPVLWQRFSYYRPILSKEFPTLGILIWDALEFKLPARNSSAFVVWSVWRWQWRWRPWTKTYYNWKATQTLTFGDANTAFSMMEKLTLMLTCLKS